MPTIRPNTVIDAKPVNIQDLLTNYVYIIPDYQRDFVWKENQVNQLLDDLMNHFKLNIDDKGLKYQPEPYFLGAIMTIPNEQMLEVIDGQQRLTTITCIASVLHEFISDIPSDSKDRDGCLQGLINVVGKYSGGSHCTKVILFDSLKDFFIESCIHKKTKSKRISYWDTDDVAIHLLKNKNSPAQRIKTAFLTSYDKIKMFVDSFSNEKRAQMLLAFVQFFLECIVILKIDASSHSTAYDLFESLNYRGMPLSQADLVKNEVIRSALNSREETIELWVEMKNNLESIGVISIPDFLHYSYLSNYSHIKASQLFEKVSSLFKKNTIDAFNYASQLKGDSEILEALIRGDNQNWTQLTNTMLHDIQSVLGIKFAYPALVAGAKKYCNDKNEFEKLVRLVMNFCFRHMKIIGGDVALLSESIAKVCGYMRDDNCQLKDVSKEFIRVAPDDLFIDKFKTASFNNAKISYFTVYYLEVSCLNGTTPLPHSNEQNLEHIMPKT